MDMDSFSGPLLYKFLSTLYDMISLFLDDYSIRYKTKSIENDVVTLFMIPFVN